MSDFWKDFSFPSPVDDILKKDDFTLEELLDEDDVVTETRNHKEALIDFLAKKEQIEALLNYFTNEPEPDATEQRKLRYPAVACEILCSEVEEIDNFIFENTEYLDKIYNFFLSDKLNPFLTNTVCRVAGSLLNTKVSKSLSYMKNKENFLDRFLKHLSNPAISDFLTKIINIEGQPEGEGTLKWLVEEKLIQKIVNQLGKDYSQDEQESASQTLLDILAVSTLDSPLMAELESEETLTVLLNNTLEDGSTALLYGTQVIIGMLNRLIEGDEDEEEVDTEAPPEWLGNLLKHLPRYKKLLINPSDTVKDLKLSFGQIKSTFGFHRLKVMELFRTLLLSCYKNVEDELLKLEIFKLSLDLFLEYEWNNFLHHVVEKMFLHVLEDDCGDDFRGKVLEQSRLIERLVETDEKNRELENSDRGVRMSNMGHILNIGMALKKLAEGNDIVKGLLSNDGWKGFDEKSLIPKEKLDATPLGGETPERPREPDSSLGGSVGSVVDDESDSDDGSEESEESDEEDEYEDDQDLDSESDADDYDIDQAEVLLTKQQIEVA